MEGNSMTFLKIQHRSLFCWSAKHINYLIQRAHILYQATYVLGSEKIALRWFESPARGLNDTSPCEALNRIFGFHEVQLLLKRIDYGIYV